MTYWPISSPSVFAATKHTNHGRTTVSCDGLECKETTGDHHGPVNGSHGLGPKESSAQRDGGVEDNGTQRPQHGASDQTVEDDIHGEIIATQMARSGHVFATLTRTTLTIWQTKACFLLCQLRLR